MSAKSLILLFLTLTLLLPQDSIAGRMHDFGCANCHPLSNLEPATGVADTLCLLCHSAGNNVPIQRLSDPSQSTDPPSGLFEAGDASNLFGSYPAELSPGAQTSHIWSASDVKPEAGALAPQESAMNLSYFGFSKDKVTCSRCHDVHDFKESNPQLLRTGAGTADAMCLDCHRVWNVQNNHGKETHPMVPDYAAVLAANPDKFRALPDNFGSSGGINLLDGNRVSCTSCHGVHWVDSDASTLDGKANADNLSVGDGRLLLHDGPDRENPDQSLCQTCHSYARHGGGSPTIGCMVCHGSHEYDPLGNPNYYMLKKEVTLNSVPKTGAAGTVDLDYTTYPASFDLDGICEQCHTLSVDHVDGYTCTDCHEHSTGFTHASGSGGYGCKACHGSDHLVNSDQEAWITFFDNSARHAYSESGEVDTYATCSMCHATNLLDQHANDCEKCHGGSTSPRDSFTSWNGTCQQGSCHPSFHAGVSDAHDEEYYDFENNQHLDCGICHDNIGWSFAWEAAGRIATPTVCGACHTLGEDTTSPVSSSDLQGAYYGTAVINVWATDARAIKVIYYRLNDGPIETASNGQIIVAAPVSGTQSHTLEYWSRDWSGNTESPHKSGSFSVTGDTVAPDTTSDARASYGGTATIQLTATDNATSLGVVATYYRFDDGSVNEGTTAVLAGPASGSETHTLYFWSVDDAGNVETEKSADFTIASDEVAPTTSTDLQELPHIYGRNDLRDGTYLDVLLTPVDPDPASGVAGVAFSSSDSRIRFENSDQAWLDNGQWKMAISWAVLLDGNSPITYAATDNAGNVEGAKTTTISADFTKPYTSSDAVTEYSGTATITLSPTDATSGVAATYYKDGLGGTVETGTNIVIDAPASGSQAHTIYYWSVDNVGNTESTRNKTFTVWEEGTDISPPTGSVSINTGADWTNSTSVTLTLAADDGGGSGVAQMRFSNDDAAWSSWEPYATSKSWTLSSGSGAKTVYVQFQDNVGKISSSYTDIIGLESTTPSTSCNASAGATYFSDNFSGVKTFTLTPADADSGVSSTWWQLDSTAGTWSSGTSVPVTAPESGTEAHTLYWYSIDSAGNQEAQQSVSFTMEAGGIQHTAISLTDTIFVDADSGATGAWLSYAIYADDVLIGTKTANATSTWDCPETAISSGGHIDILVNAGFSSYSYILGSNVPVTYTIDVPVGTTRLAAATWSGFPNKSVVSSFDDNYEEFTTVVSAAATTIENIAFVTATPDTTAPVTTSNVVSGGLYVGNQTFTLSPADVGGTGVEGTWWQLDSTTGAWTAGTTITVNAPATGTAAHTLYWRSTDYAGNQEANQSVSFNLEAASGAETANLSVSLDSTVDYWVDYYAAKPVSGPYLRYQIYVDDVYKGQVLQTQSSPAKSSWNCPLTTISAGSHIDIVVDAWFTQVNGATPDPAGIYHRVFTSAAFPVGAKRLEAVSWSGFPQMNWASWEYDEDWDWEYAYVSMPVGTITNIRYATTGSDTTAPVTTCSASDGGNYVGDQTFTLTPTDVGSGVESTWWALDASSGAWNIGTSIPVAAPETGTVSHTIYWYSRDNATNQETVNSVSFDVTATGG